MSLAVTAINDRHVSRKLTVNIHQHTLNVRPIIKGAIKEAANTLTDAYSSNTIMGWCVRGLQPTKHDEFLYTLFKNMIDSCSRQSRDFAIQVEGCKGVLTWTNNPSGISWPRILSTAKLARLIGWTSALRAVTKVAPSCDKIKRKIMAAYPHYVTIGFLGILPHEQRKGYASCLVRHVLDKADEAKLPVYVEACDPSSVRLFENFGFTIQGTVFIANREELPVAIMVRRPIDQGAPAPLRIRPGRTISESSVQTQS
jgi:ribosomal protein S18 acetylase RimI-like enzyme